jgi:hypothetical protein
MAAAPAAALMSGLWQCDWAPITARDRDRRERVAVHESGHAIAALCTGHEGLLRAEMREPGDPECAGQVLLRFGEQDHIGGPHASRLVVIYLAGAAAVRRYLGRPIADLREVLAHDDAAKIEALLQLPDVIDLATAVEAADALLEQNWPAVLRVAEALLESERLGYESLRRIAGM